MKRKEKKINVTYSSTNETDINSIIYRLIMIHEK